MEVTVPAATSDNLHIALTLIDMTRFLIQNKIDRVELPEPVWSFFMSQMPSQCRFTRESEPRVHFIFSGVMFFKDER